MKEWFINLWNKIVSFFSDNINNIITFFAVFVIGIIVINILMRLFKKSLKRHDTDPMSAKFFVELIRFCLYLVFILILLQTMGVAITGFVTALSALVLAIGMALKENIANLVNGLIIIKGVLFFILILILKIGCGILFRLHFDNFHKYVLLIYIFFLIIYAIFFFMIRIFLPSLCS